MRIFEGIIVSLKMKDTVVVEVTRRTPHPLYRKLIKTSKKFKADNGGLELVLGAKVRIAETSPISKGKFFKVLETKTETKKAKKKKEEVNGTA